MAMKRAIKVWNLIQSSLHAFQKTDNRRQGLVDWDSRYEMLDTGNISRCPQHATLPSHNLAISNNAFAVSC